MKKFILVLSVFLASSLLAKDFVVDIENPNFRRVIIANPQFQLDSASGSLADEFSKNGSGKLSELLKFSGFFNVVSSAAYDSYLKKMIDSRRKKEGSDWLSKMKKLKGDELVQWRSIGVDALTLVSVEKSFGSINIVAKTFDVKRNQQVVAKKIASVKLFKRTVQQIADYILEAYTGKPGIFSSKLTFVGRRKKGASKQIFISDFDGSNLKQISSGNVPHLSPQWSPDARYVAFTSFESGNPHIYVYDTKTNTKRRLTNTKGLNSGANWSPDSKYIAYTASNGGDTDIYVLPSKGGSRKLMIKGSGLDVDPKFSPDGKKLAFVSGRYGNPHIFVSKLAYDTARPRVISDRRLTYAGWYNSTPAWSPDSKKIIFGGYDKDIDRYDIFIMNPDGSKLERLTLKTGDNESPSWSPNGQMIVFQSNRIGQSNVKGRPALFMMNRDGSSQQRLNIPLYEVQTPHWSAPVGY